MLTSGHATAVSPEIPHLDRGTDAGIGGPTTINDVAPDPQQSSFQETHPKSGEIPANRWSQAGRLGTVHIGRDSYVVGMNTNFLRVRVRASWI
jgi:hypothetical protein